MLKKTNRFRILCTLALFIAISSVLYAQENTGKVTGVVIADGGSELFSASVSAINLKTKKVYNVNTDATGKFVFENLPLSGTYSFTAAYVGYESRTISGIVLNKDQVNSVILSLKASSTNLDEVVVVGYGTQKKRNVTGSVSTFKPSEIAGQSVSSPNQLLQGRVSGINITNSSGVPGAGVRVSIRGIGSINGSNEPLYVIDGIPVNNTDTSPLNGQNFGGGVSNPLSTINPSDIESFDILKDAAAASIYGSRATNGVIIITTKKGKSGKTEVNFNSYIGFQNLPKTIKEVNTETYFKVLNEARTNYNSQLGLTSAMSGFLTPLSDPRSVKIADTDWVGLVTNKDAFTNNNDISLRGGTDITKFYSSLSYTNQDGTIKTSRFERFSGRLNVDHKVSERISLGMNVMLSKTIMNRIPSDLAGNAILLRALEQRPYDVPYKADGTYSVGGVDILRHNGVQSLNEEKSENKANRALASINATVKIIDGLSYKGTFSNDMGNTHDYLYLNQNHPYGRPAGVVYDYTSNNSNIIIDNLLTFDKKWDHISLNAIAGHSFQKTSTEVTYIDGRDFPSPAFGYINAAARINQAYTNWTGYALESYFSRATVTYLDKYTVTGTIRSDGSSRFATGKNYGTFPSASFGWRVSEESFLKNVKWLDNLKLRTSYGLTGNQEGIGDFASFPLVTGGNGYNGQIGLAVTQLGNNDLKWEKANQTNIGIDMDVLQNRLSFTADYFVKNTNDLLFNLPVVSTSGFTTQVLNIGAMKNKGIELSLNSKNLTGDFKWSTDFNISFITNEVTKLQNNAPIVTDNYHVLQVGQSVGSFYMLQQTGIYQKDSEVPIALYSKGVRAGDIQFLDVNNDGNITSADRLITGSALPKYFGGISNKISYKNFDLTMLTNFSVGNKIFAYWRGNSFGDGIDGIGGNQFNMLSETTDARWTGEGTSNTVPRAIWATANGNYNKQISTRYLEDGSYFRVKNITLGYSLPIKSTKVIKSVRLYCSGQNLFTITKYKGFDPEVTASIDPRNLGIDAGTVPQSREILFGINAKF